VGLVIQRPQRIEIDCMPPTVEQLRHPALAGYGHFTAMQVRHGKVRGLALHLDRLDRATRELFGIDLGGGRVRTAITHALGDTTTASVRVIVFRPEEDGDVSVMVTVREPASAPISPQRLQTAAYQRPAPHIKHTGGFGQTYYGELARRSGYHDALLTGANGVISEAAIANIAFFDGTALVWPDTPALLGITMQLLAPALTGCGIPSVHRTVRLSDLPSFDAALVTNSHGVAAVERIDARPIPVNDDLTRTAIDTYESVPWDPI